MDYKKYPKSLRIGFVGDQNARTPTVDISELLPELPGATATLLFRRPGEETAYPAAAQLDENGILTWTVSGGDARYPGTGCAQVLLQKGTGADEQRLLGPVIMVTVLNSIAGLTSEDAPEGFESWIAEIEAAGEEAAQDAEAWAKGTRGGTAVESTDPAYHANAAYHASQAGDSASDAEAYAKGTRGGTAVESTDPAYHANAAYHAGQAGDSASDAEAFARGTRGGADVGSSDPAYHNNAKYYAEQAAASAEEAGRSYAPAIRATASGSVAHFTDAVAAPMALDIVINPNQAGSGDPSPSNVRTISSRAKVTVSRSGADTGDADEYEITFPDDAGTVYGGTLHINQDGSGVLTVDRAITTVNDQSWTYNSGASQRRFTATFSGIKLYAAARTVPFTSSVFVSIDDGRALGDVPNNGIYGAGTSGTVYIKCTDYSTESAFKAAYGSAQIVYPIANPQSYTFTAQQISSLLGENNVWADTGDVTAEYTADTKTYIERLTQPDQDWVADAGISIGKFFMVGNELYIATSGIAAGETIAPGTNCTKMSLAQALNNINA